MSSRQKPKVCLRPHPGRQRWTWAGMPAQSGWSLATYQGTDVLARLSKSGGVTVYMLSGSKHVAVSDVKFH